MKCYYCETWHSVPKSLRKIDDANPKRKISLRFCKRKGKDIIGDNEWCSHFSLHKNIWCQRGEQWLHIILCLERYKKKINGCSGCPQFEEIVECARGKDLYSYFEIERKSPPLLLRRKRK